eukprot:9092015-Heterocapsa_arctica.AAC.1
MEKYGSENFGGSFEQWGNAFKIKKDMRAEEVEFVEHNPEEDTERTAGDVLVGSLEETVNIVRLAELMEQSDAPDPALESVLRRFTGDTANRDGDFSTATVSYYKKFGIPGR